MLAAARGQTYTYLKEQMSARTTWLGIALLGLTIRHTFGAEYAITDLEHEAFLAKTATIWGAGLAEVYRDEYAVIFQVVEG